MTRKAILSLLLGRVSRNIIFWMLYTLWHFQSRDYNRIADWYFPMLVHIVIFFGTFCYINTLWLIPKFLLRRKYGLYALGISVVLVANSIVSSYAADLINARYPGINFMGAEHVAWYYHLVPCAWTMIIVSLGKFMADSIHQQIKLENLQKQRLESELSALRSQINPHFLFNALNTIYGMSRRNNPDTPDAILKLSDILRHNLYECDEPEIPLEKEVYMLSQYIELNRLRQHDKSSIQLDINVSFGSQKIAPLLLIPFVENAIKHGPGSNAQNGWMQVKLTLDGNTLFFTCANGYKKKIDGNQRRGIGLNNVQRRLQLLYPGRHQLHITDTDGIYAVQLVLDLPGSTGIIERGDSLFLKPVAGS